MIEKFIEKIETQIDNDIYSSNDDYIKINQLIKIDENIFKVVAYAIANPSTIWYPERFEIIEDTLAAAFPDFERLGFPPVAAGTITMTWKDKNFSKPIYMHQLSEGTLRFIWLITLLQSPGLTAVTLIDEPEVSLHPELLRLLADMMREASQKTQLIVATHSDRLIRFLNPEEVLVCDAEDGLTTMRWGDSFNLEHWLEEYSLDQVWAMNLMGGRP
jgi:predicted ATPase